MEENHEMTAMMVMTMGEKRMVTKWYKHKGEHFARIVTGDM